MTKTLNNAFEAAAKLPEREQEELVASLRRRERASGGPVGGP